MKRLLFFLIIVPFFAKSQTHSWHNDIITINWPNSKTIKLRVSAFVGLSSDTVYILGFSETKNSRKPISIGFENKSQLRSFIQSAYEAERKHDVHDDITFTTVTSTVNIIWINDRLFINAYGNPNSTAGSVELTYNDIQQLLKL